MGVQRTVGQSRVQLQRFVFICKKVWKQVVGLIIKPAEYDLDELWRKETVRSFLPLNIQYIF